VPICPHDAVPRPPGDCPRPGDVIRREAGGGRAWAPVRSVAEHAAAEGTSLSCYGRVVHVPSVDALRPGQLVQAPGDEAGAVARYCLALRGVEAPLIKLGAPVPVGEELWPGSAEVRVREVSPRRAWLRDRRRPAGTRANRSSDAGCPGADDQSHCAEAVPTVAGVPLLGGVVQRALAEPVEVLPHAGEPAAVLGPPRPLEHVGVRPDPGDTADEPLELLDPTVKIRGDALEPPPKGLHLLDAHALRDAGHGVTPPSLVAGSGWAGAATARSPSAGPTRCSARSGRSRRGPGRSCRGGHGDRPTMGP
jgi:hypothetical protein